MSYRRAMVALRWMVLAAATARAGDQPGDRRDPGSTFLHRLAPVGGCDPDGGGPFHWWNPDCFPRPCAPDDYCRKPFPRFCGPPAALISTPARTRPTARPEPRRWAHGNSP